MIGERFNFEDVFFRDLTVCVLDTLEGEVRWVNKFSSGDRVVNVPFYYSMTGDERFLLDSFTDDIVSGDSTGNGRYLELNTDIIPRGHLTMKSFSMTDYYIDKYAKPKHAEILKRFFIRGETQASIANSLGLKQQSIGSMVARFKGKVKKNHGNK
jgi:hypothetical protein